MKLIIKPFYSSFLVSLLIIFSVSCSSDSDPGPEFDCNLSDLSIDLVGTTGLSGCTTLDGALEVNATGGAGSNEFRINGGAPQSNGVFTNLGAGTYEVSVQDDNGCTAILTVTISAANSNLAISDVTSTEAGCGMSSGQLTVDAAGDGEVLYRLDQGSFQTSNMFTGLEAGNYTVTVRDDLCETSQSHRVMSGVSYDAQVEAIITSNCAISGCHNGSNSLPNFSVLSNVQSRASNIRSRTQNGSMPPASSGRTLSQEQKDLIACWVDDGALDN